MVELYTKPNCPNCKKTKRMLKFGKIEFKEIDVTEDEKAFDFVKNELGFSQLPVINADSFEPFAYSKDKVAQFVKEYRT